MIEFIDVSKDFKYKQSEIRVLNNVNLKINKNEMVALMGPSGSGKTTILNISGGILKQSDGKYLFKDKLVSGDESTMARFRNRNIGFILQHFGLIKNRNVFYNISLPLKYRNVTKQEINNKVLEISNILGISNTLKKYPHILSGGERQRVAIARAIISNPSVILADEPTNSLDKNNKYEVLNILRSLNNKGITIVIATHDYEVAKFCDRIINIENINGI